MADSPVSQTAIGSALLRATHPFVDDPPHLIDDPYALGLSGWATIDEAVASFDVLERELEPKLTAEGAKRFVRDLRAVTVLRARLAEELLSAAVARGMQQCVVLGAGLDSTAHRLDPRWSACTFFEVDQPATQAWKIEQLAALGAPKHSRVVFVPLDLAEPDLEIALVAKGFRIFEPAFVIWLGVTPYLSSSATEATLRRFSRWAPGSEMLFDYVVVEEYLDDFGRAAIKALRHEMSEMGEPGQTAYDPLAFGRRLQAMGFRNIHCYAEEELNKIYFSARRDGLELPKRCAARWVWLRT